ncbi:MAG: TonB-dependent receptor [Bacteroidota bacterium]|nr:TonB-dependent receptor [Bacteroidota bacterium]
MKLNILTILFVFFISINTNAQERKRPQGNMPEIGQLIAVVIDNDTKHLVEYASFALYNMRDSSLVAGAIADKSGKIFLKELPFGRYYAIVTFIGYENKEIKNIMINPKNQHKNLGVIAIKQAAIELEEVEVGAERKHIEYRIDKKVINVSKDIIASGGTAIDVLENTPSIQTDVDGNISLRGSSNFQLLINGKPSVLSGNDALKQIPASTVKQIEIITNPSAKYDPDGVAGIINLIMKKQEGEGVNGIINASIGSFGNHSVDFLLNYRKGNFNFFTSLNYNERKRPGTSIMERESFLTDTTNFLTFEADRDRHHGGYEAKAGFDYIINEKNSLTLSGEYGLRSFGFNFESKYHEYSDPFDTNIYYYRENEMNIQNNYYVADLFYQHDFNGESHNLTTNIHYSLRGGEDTETNSEYQTLEDWLIEGVTPENQRSFEINDGYKFRVKVDYTKKFSENGKLEAGLQSRIDISNSVYDLENYNVTLDKWIKNAEQHNSIDVQKNIHSAYGTFTNELFGFGFMAGLRAEYTDRIISQNILNDDFVINRVDIFPSFHISKKLPADQQLLASYSKRINRPRDWYLDPFPHYIDDKNIRQGNPNLEPELINSLEFGYQKRIKSSFLSLEAYYRETNNKISRIHRMIENEVMIHTFDNITKDYSLGFEFMGNIEIKKWWTINASANFFKYHIEGEIIDDDVNQAINTWSSRLNSTINLKTKTKIQLSGFYSAPSITAQGERDDFFFTSIAIRQDFLKRKLSLTFRVRDIFGTMNHAFTSYGIYFIQSNEFKRLSPSYNLSISYQLNNYKKKKRSSSEGTNYEGIDQM